MKMQIVIVSECCKCFKPIFQIPQDTKLATMSRLMTEAEEDYCYCNQCKQDSNWKVGLILHIEGAVYL